MEKETVESIASAEERPVNGDAMCGPHNRGPREILSVW